MLPQAYPFRLLDAATPLDGGGLRVRLSAGAATLRSGPWPPCLAVEVLAQASAVLLAAETAHATPDRPRQHLLAGLEQVRFAAELARRPLAAGDELEVHVRELGRFALLVKVRARLERAKSSLVEGNLLLTS